MLFFNWHHSFHNGEFSEIKQAVYTVCIKIIRIQIWHVITQNIFDKFGWFLHDC